MCMKDIEVNLRRDFLNVRGSVVYDDVLHALGHRGVHKPSVADSLFVGLACGAGRSRESDYMEPRVVFEQGCEALANHTRSADNADIKLLFHNVVHLSEYIFYSKKTDEFHRL